MNKEQLSKSITIDHLFGKDEYYRGEVLKGSMAVVHMVMRYITTPRNALVDNPDMAWDLREMRFINDKPTLIDAELSKLRNNLIRLFPKDDIAVDSVRRTDSNVLDIVFTVNSEIVGSIDTTRLERNYEDWLSLSTL